MKQIILLPIFMLSLIITSLSYAHDSCFTLVKENFLDDKVIWGTISARNYHEYKHQLTNIGVGGNFDGINGEFPIYNEKAILNGEQNVLSMGEGAATYIKTLLEMKEDTLPPGSTIDNIHAVDLAYTNIDSNIYDPTVKQFISMHPDNYHGAYFQEFSLLNSFGQKVLFDEIISSYSLTHMLEDQLELLEVVIKQNLKPGGHLRIWPMYGDLYQALLPYLERMLKSGLIDNYTQVSPKRLPSVFIIRRTN